MSLDSTQSSLSSKEAMVILVPILIIIGALIVMIFIVPTSFSQITSKFQSYKEYTQVEETLTKKLSTLQNVPPDALNQTAQSVIVLPDKNPTLGLISQIKEIALVNNVLITDIKTGSVSEFGSDTQRIELTITIGGAEDFTSLINVISKIEENAPISTIDSVQLQDEGNAKKAVVKISGFWSALPNTLPAMTDAIQPLSSEELAILDQISKLSSPQFVILNPEESTTRENPFN